MNIAVLCFSKVVWSYNPFCCRYYIIKLHYLYKCTFRYLETYTYPIQDQFPSQSIKTS